MFAASGHLLGEAEPGGQRIRVRRPQFVPLISQSPLVQHYCLVRTPGLLVGRCPTRVSCQRIRVIQPQFVLLISQSPLVQRDCDIGVVPLEPERHPQCVSKFPATRISTFGNLRKGLHQDVIRSRRKAGPPRRQPRRRHRQVRVQHRHARIPDKWWLTRQQREGRARQRVLISACVDSPTWPTDSATRQISAGASASPAPAAPGAHHSPQPPGEYAQ